MLDFHFLKTKNLQYLEGYDFFEVKELEIDCIIMGLTFWQIKSKRENIKNPIFL